MNAGVAPGQEAVPTIDIPDKATALPIPLLEPDPKLGLNEQETEQWYKMTEDFVKEAGGANQDPSDPAYLKAWQNAQWLADQQFRIMFGTSAFNSQGLRAAQEMGQTANP